MQLNEICLALAKLERNNDVNQIKLNGHTLWPLIRQSIWSEIIDQSRQHIIKEHDRALNYNPKIEQIRSLYSKIKQKIHNRGANLKNFDTGITTALISRPINLQKLPKDSLYFDRIIDPLYFLSENPQSIKKCYVSSYPLETKLFYPAQYFQAGISVRTPSFDIVKDEIEQLYQNVGLPKKNVSSGFGRAWKNFNTWYTHSKRLFSSSRDLKHIYLSCWYFPDMMGIIAAAKRYGITTIDVQHGKQGKYQAMYSWWTNIPPEGYQMLPDHFWCWGQPSCDHILSSSPSRRFHKPFIGGYPWPDYYNKYVATQKKIKSIDHKRRILVTLQSPIQGHAQPIPDFLIEFLASETCKDTFITFRCHPNFKQGEEYGAFRLQGILKDRYEFCDRSANLFDQLSSSTHHITAFSSCCYEAEMFEIPTLLFGSEAESIYSEEIISGRFAWTGGQLQDLEDWLQHPPIKYIKNIDSYIISSLAHSRKVFKESK